ncbi:MAG: rRNA maturation RNase YbeY [Pseudomonadota bacterium]
MAIEVDYQVTIPDPDNSLPDADQIQRWVTAALALARPGQDDAELTVRVVSKEEGQQLNKDYRARDYPTNVLSFPFEAPVELPVPLLGDLVICAEVVEDEAKQQHKAVIDHWTHMVIHGTLHLLGYDHLADDEAEIMEQLERQILAKLDIADPYQVFTNTEHNA